VAKWMCSKCEIEVDKVDDIKIFYKDLDLPPAAGYRCPQCGIEYIDGEYAVNDLVSVEEMLDGK
jgi:hypothetical protein